MKKNFILLVLIVALVGMSGVVSATDYYVATWGNDSNSGTSLDFPWQHPSYAAQRVVAGDTIYLMDGTWYDEHVVFAHSGNATHPIIMTAYNGTPTLDGQDCSNTGGKGIEIWPSSGRLSYINISNLHIKNYRWGIYIRKADHIHVSNCELSLLYATPVSFTDTTHSSIKNCHIHDYGWNGIGIQAENILTHHITVENNTIHDSPGLTTEIGHNCIDLYQYGPGENIISDVNIINNVGWNAWNGIYGHTNINPLMERINITNNIFINCPHGIRVSLFNNSIVSNNVLYNCSSAGIVSQSEGVAGSTLNPIVTIKNNIIVNNFNGFYCTRGANLTLSYNDVWNNTDDYNHIDPGATDISVDPLFADPVNRDFHLKSQYGRWNGSAWVNDAVTSPCIDAGDPSDDYSNEPEPNGDRINMGAYGNTAEASKSPSGCYTYKLVNPGESIQAAIDSICPEGSIVELASGVHDVYDTIVINRSNVTIQGTHESEIRSNNSSCDIFAIPHAKPVYNESWSTMPILDNITFEGFNISSTYQTLAPLYVFNIWNVKNVTIKNITDYSYIKTFAGVNPTGEGTTASAENIYIDNNTIQYGGIFFAFSKNVYVTNNTIVRGNGAHALNANRNNNGIYIIGNYIHTYDDYMGGVNLYASTNFDVRDNIIDGGRYGLFFQSFPSNASVSNNTIKNSRTAGVNFRLYASSYGQKNNTFKNNRIYNVYQGHGINTEDMGGITVMSYGAVLNNVIFNCSGHGINTITAWMNLTLKNNIIANNGGYGINHGAGGLTFSYNDVWNNALGNYNGTSAGIGDISADPLFTNPPNDFHLKSTAGRWTSGGWVTDSFTSPCIDAGDPSSDYSNEPAPNGGRINMGAYGNTQEASKSAGGTTTTTTSTSTTSTTTTTIPDTTPPAITIQSPQPITYGNKIIPLNFTANEPLSTCRLSVDSTVNQTLQNCENLSVISKEYQTTTGTVAWWHFNGNATDSSGNNNHGAVNGASFVDGKFSKALNFNGINNYVRVNNSDSLDTINKEITIEAWIKTNFSQRGTIVENWFYNKSSIPVIGNRSYICTVRNDGKVDFAISPYGNGSDAVWLNSNNSIKADKWTHAVFLSNGTDMSIYVNGVLDGRTIAPSQIHLSNRPIHIGMWFAEEVGESPFTSYFNGVIDELRILNRSLTQEEILTDYALGEGSHSVTVYANDTSGNWNSSAVYFGIGTSTTTTTAVTTTSTTTTSTTISVTTTTTSTTTVPTTTTTTSTSTTTLPCDLPGDYPTCGEVTLAEVVDFIILWSQDLADLEDVINLINAWSAG